MNTMSSTLQASSSSSSTPNFQPIFKKALKVYKKKTGEDLINHPLAAEIDGCGSPDAILTVLQAKVNDLDQSNDQRLTRWLTPAVNVVNVLSATRTGRWFGEFQQVPRHCLRLNVIFSGIPPYQ
jgi:hypothetical protein